MGTHISLNKVILCRVIIFTKKSNHLIKIPVSPTWETYIPVSG